MTIIVSDLNAGYWVGLILAAGFCIGLIYAIVEEILHHRGD